MLSQKLSSEELEKLNSFQSLYNQIAFELGENSIQNTILENQKNDILSKLVELKKEQDIYAQTLQGKYGEGEINLETGEFIKETK